MDLVDSKYIGLVSSRLQKFKRVKADLYNFRCPICGDSQRNKNKARGYIYSVKNNTNFKCHNCGASLSFNNFLKEIDLTLHKQYTAIDISGENGSQPYDLSLLHDFGVQYDLLVDASMEAISGAMSTVFGATEWVCASASLPDVA